MHDFPVFPFRPHASIAQDPGRCPFRSCGGSVKELCDRVAGQFIKYCVQHKGPAKARKVLEEEIHHKFGMPPEQARALVDLAMEVIHLKVHGCYRLPDPEIGRLIVFAITGRIEPGLS